MTIHRRPEQLIAASIDFELSPAERAELDGHLATCPSCRALAAGYRSDAAMMREIAFVTPPAGVRAAVLADAARPGARSRASWRLVAAAALLLAALVGAVMAIGAWDPRPTLVITIPVAPSPGPTAGPTAASSAPAPTPSPIVAPPALAAACDGTRPSIPTPMVRAQADGVHVRIANTSGRPLDISIEDATGLAIQGDSIAGPTGEHTYLLAPGSYRFECNGSVLPFAVVDPDGRYIPPDLSCEPPGSGAVGVSDHAPGARGPTGSVVDVARAQLRGLEPTDAIERAGYPQAAGDQSVRVVRNGEVVALVTYVGDGRGGWLVGATRSCPGSGVSIEAPID